MYIFSLSLVISRSCSWFSVHFSRTINLVRSPHYVRCSGLAVRWIIELFVNVKVFLSISMIIISLRCLFSALKINRKCARDV